MAGVNESDPSYPWSWFCGGNYSLWEIDEPLQHVCHVDLFSSFVHLVFFVLLSAVLIIAGLCFSRRNEKRLFHRYPLHTSQWLMMLVVSVFYLCSLAEGFLTDATYQSNVLGEVYPTQPHLYVPSICGLVMTCLAMVYYHHMEAWRLPHMVWYLLIYWALVLAGQILNLMALIETNTTSVLVLRFDVCLIAILTSLCLCFFQVYIIKVKICCFVVRCYKKDPPKDMKFTQEYSNFLSEYSFYWLNWVFLLGYKRPVQKDDLGSLPDIHTASHIHVKFRNAFQKEQRRAQTKNCKVSLWRVYWSVHGWMILFSQIAKIAADLCDIVGPLTLINIIPWAQGVIEGSEDSYEPHFVTVSEFFENGLVLVGILFVVLCMRAYLVQAFEYCSTVVGIHIRSAVQTMVFEKSLRVSTFIMSSGEMSMGQITNHMSIDAMNIFYMCQFYGWLGSLPIQVAVAIGFLIMLLELSAVIGVAVFLFVVPLQIFASKYMAKQEDKALEHADDRLKMTNEVLQGIKLLKMYGWEDLFGDFIKKIRKLEMYAVTKMMVCYGLIAAVTEASPFLVTLLSFGTFTSITGKILTPDVAFSSVSLFNRLRVSLYMFPMSLFNTVNGVISTGRIEAFLCAPEVDMKSLEAIKVRKPDHRGRQNGRPESVTQATDEYETYFSDGDVEVPLLKTKTPPKGSNSSLQSATNETDAYGSVSNSVPTAANSKVRGLRDDVAIKITKGSFVWGAGISQPTLIDINVTIPAGKLTMVVGTVGSGKSSLMSAILEEMFIVNGSLQINGNRQSIAYAGQRAWLMNTTLKENILFGRSFHPKRYHNVIEGSALQSDIDMLPAGDQTEIGEKGINVSGGQKQRISVARAIYSGRDIVLLDDPLSALDVHVGEHLFQHGIMGILRKKKKTVILVTHQLQYLAHADKIIVMKDGKIGETGTFDDISAADPDFYNSYQKAVQKMTEESETSDAESSRKQDKMYIKRQFSASGSYAVEKPDETADEKGRLMADEEQEKGSVAFGVYWFYARAIGLLAVTAVCVLFPIKAGMNAVSNIWLSAWTDAEYNQANTTDARHYIVIYAVISVVGICVSVVTQLFAALIFLGAAKRLLVGMLNAVTHMPMRFFDTTPIGRIINRFAADTQIIDLKLTVQYSSILFFISSIGAGLILNVYVNPIFLAIVVPVAIVYYFIRKVFITTSRELQRLDSIYKSPIFALFSETLGGLSTIRAYRKQQAFFDDTVNRVVNNNVIFMYLQTSLRWLGLRLDLIGALVVLISGLTTVLGAINGTVNSADVGLGISYALMIAGMLQLVVRFLAETEMQMNAVERVKYYSTMTSECYEGIEPPINWPSKGAISIENISVRYAAELDPVLKNVSIQIEAGNKVGICGRTGSGKSSLTLALYRIIDTFKGRIAIDDIDIATVPLTTLRRRLAIIPQDPVLFNGTVRSNLDPENQRTEDELWHALEIAQLKNLVAQSDGGLDSIVSEGGETFSVGQRQLFCLARAFLRNAHVLIMDEATASIDIETDKILQRVVATVFDGKTILTIAHRVATILNSDTILTLSQGEVIEHDTPDNLLMEPDSVFASLVHNNQ